MVLFICQLIFKLFDFTFRLLSPRKHSVVKWAIKIDWYRDTKWDELSQEKTDFFCSNNTILETNQLSEKHLFEVGPPNPIRLLIIICWRTYWIYFTFCMAQTGFPHLCSQFFLFQNLFGNFFLRRVFLYLPLCPDEHLLEGWEILRSLLRLTDYQTLFIFFRFKTNSANLPVRAGGVVAERFNNV